jgi:preprotein translocase subunit SecE
VAVQAAARHADFRSSLEVRRASPYLPDDHARKGSVMAKTNPMQFVQQVRAEVAKVVWPTRREVVLTTIMVFIMATLTAIFFALVDLGIRSGLQGILSVFAG